MGIKRGFPILVVQSKDSEKISLSLTSEAVDEYGSEE